MPPHTSIFLRLEIIKKNKPYRIDLKISADYDYILNLFKRKQLKICYFNRPIVNMSLGGTSTSGVRSLIKKIKEILLCFLPITEFSVSYHLFLRDF